MAEIKRRAFLGGLLAISLLVVVLNLCGFLANAYAGFARSQFRFADTRPAVRQAALLIQKLDFRNAEAVQLLAEDDLYAGRRGQALDEYEQALKLAPADAFLWRDYALARISSGLIDTDLEKAVAQAQELAPKSRPLQISLALAGLKIYALSSPGLRARWLESLRLAYLFQPKGLIFAAYVSGQDLMLCEKVIPDSGSNPWCIQSRWRHGLCQSPSHPESCRAANAKALK